MRTKNSSYNMRIFLILSAAIVFAFLVFRNSGRYPTIFSDEYFYSKFSRFLPFSNSSIPVYVYLMIYRITNICGDQFLFCARILNALFFVAATPFIYAIAKRVCSRNVSFMVVLLALLGPINSYTVYFMPESLYFFWFWVFTWFILQLDNSSKARLWCLSGVLLGLFALVKPHAVFLLPAIVGYIVYVTRRKEGVWLQRSFRNIGLFMIGAFVTKLLLGYFFAGKAGVTILGVGYASALTTVLPNVQRYSEFFAALAKNLTGHALAMCLMFGVPIAVLIKTTFKSKAHQAEIRPDQKIVFYTLLVLCNLVLLAGFFSAIVSDNNAVKMSVRLHMRFYNFVFPLLLIITASQLFADIKTRQRRWRMVIAFPIGVAMAYAVYTRLAAHINFSFDSPELCGFTYHSIGFYVLSGISFLALVLWVYGERVGAAIFIYLCMPLTVIFSTVYINQFLKPYLVPSVFDNAGIFTKQHLSDEELSKLVVVGSELKELFHVAFYLNNVGVSLDRIPVGAEYDLARLQHGKEWVLVIGEHSLPPSDFDQFSGNYFTLTRVMGPTTVINFKKSSWPGVITRTSGLSGTEEWGTWSVGKVVTFEFAAPLPKKFALHLVANTFIPNVGKEFVGRVGDSAVRFTLGEAPEEKVLEFTNPTKSRILAFEVPSPASPYELGMGKDERSLGIAFIELMIESR